MLIIHTSLEIKVDIGEIALKGDKNHIICGCYPERTIGLILPRDFITWARTNLIPWAKGEVTRIMFTANEYIFLVLCQEIRRGNLRPDQVRVIYHCASGEPLELPLDEEGEFRVRWPNGFFTERSDLLFGD